MTGLKLHLNKLIRVLNNQVFSLDQFLNAIF